MNTTGLKKIGQGAFTTCYRLNTKEVLLKSTDYIKECMAFGWFPESNIFPEIESVEQYVYKSKYYERVTSLKNTLKPKQYEIYKELRQLKVDYNVKDYDLLDEWRKQFETVSNKRFREALLEAVDSCANYGSDVSFEISPRNVAVDKGMLILLDCFFIKSQLNKIRS